MNRVAKEANNHFGIMCHTSEWTGETFYETENHSSDYCYRKYASVKESYRDHSLFLSQRSRYVKLFYYPITDYKSWAIGLKEAGYSGNPRYADTLISIIEKYYLMHYDRKVALKIGDTTALQAMTAPQPERATNTTTTPISYTTTATSQPSTIKSAQTPEDQAPKTQPVAAQTTLRLSSSHLRNPSKTRSKSTASTSLSIKRTAQDGEIRYHRHYSPVTGKSGWQKCLCPRPLFCAV